ncbi:hypothetical protein [Spirillospora sp. NPDC047279]|uniref:hypothetical protein n=1 Tax=Spirillospora sp. NPDC047279 TaxID=3155478 RepID=UPI00340F348D
MYETTAVGPRWSAVRRLAGYGAALTMSCYLGVKAVWVVAGLFGHGPSGMRLAEWLLLNVATVGMSGVGVALGLALAQPWGRGLPARPLVFVAWTGSGFLVPLLPYMVVSAVLGGGQESGGENAMPAWEVVLLTIGFMGMAAGLALALPIYLRERWPGAFLGRAGGAAGRPSAPLLVLVTGLGVLWLSWAFGGTLGLDPAQAARMDTNARLMIGNAGIWALVAAGALWVLTTGHALSRLPRWVPMTLGFAASGSLFAWSAWKLPLALLRPGDYRSVEYVPVAVVEHGLSIGAGIAILVALLRTAVGARWRSSDIDG